MQKLSSGFHQGRFHQGIFPQTFESSMIKIKRIHRYEVAAIIYFLWLLTNHQNSELENIHLENSCNACSNLIESLNKYSDTQDIDDIIDKNSNLFGSLIENAGALIPDVLKDKSIHEESKKRFEELSLEFQVFILQIINLHLAAQQGRFNQNDLGQICWRDYETFLSKIKKISPIKPYFKTIN
ncbi:MAG: hypothetical protein VKL42_00950 [Snowella sp.]|nr:hypothetical protein [Snowella sp.]